MATDPRIGFHNWRYGFYNGNRWQRLENLELHLTDSSSITYNRDGSSYAALCGETADKFAPATTVNIATRINKSKVCQTCQTLAEKEMES